MTILLTLLAGLAVAPLTVEVVQPDGVVIIGQDHPDAQGIKYGFEGGCALKANGEYHILTAEMWGDPYWVAMRLGHWKSRDLKTWKRHATLFESTGAGHETDNKYSIWSPMAVFNAKEDRWNLFYVCYEGKQRPDEGTHMRGKIFRAVSKTAGEAGIDGPWEDANILMRPDAESMAWEGQQSVDSFYPYRVGDRWYSHYGGHNYTPIGPWLVGMATAPDLAGPWKRIPELSPCAFEPEFIENPIVSRIGDQWVAVYDSTTIEPGNKYILNPREIGYACSADGIHWLSGQRLAIHSDSEKNWSGDLRTPLGLIPMDDGTHALPYTGSKKGVQYANVGLVFVRVAAQAK
jgi:hypothetical protein